MNKIAPLAGAAFLAAALVASCGAEEPGHSVRVTWTPTSAAEVRALCGNDYDDGCVRRSEDGIECRIITEPMPLAEFTGANHDMVSSQWRALSHELLHCFGYEHRAP